MSLKCYNRQHHGTNIDKIESYNNQKQILMSKTIHKFALIKPIQIGHVKFAVTIKLGMGSNGWHLGSNNKHFSIYGDNNVI